MISLSGLNLDLDLLIGKKVLLEYIWLDVNNEFRSKVKVIEYNSTLLYNLEIWNFDGSSTGQQTGQGFNSEVLLKPFKVFQESTDLTYFYVFCECLDIKGKVHKTNTRDETFNFFNREEVKKLETIFGIEQEFFVFENGKPLLWNNELTEPQGKYYCGNGSKNIKGREFLDEVVKVLNSWNINITGYNFEVAPAQMEIQICEKGIDASDNLIASRFILVRLAEKRGWTIDFSAKPQFLNNDRWNGSGCHVNFSIKDIRTLDVKKPLGALYEMSKIIANLKNNHSLDISNYGLEDNKIRLSGRNETSNYDIFNYGVGNRNCSVRIPTSVVNNLSGYIEDRRPASNMDPYIVTRLITSACFSTNINQEEVNNISISILNNNLNNLCSN